LQIFPAASARINQNISGQRSGGNIIIVDINGSGNFTSIQDAIDSASAGDTLRVRAGTYFENVVINKTISLIGESNKTTIVDGNGKGVVIKITANWVNVSGFSIMNSSGVPIPSDTPSGIKLNGPSNCKISNCNIFKNKYGIQHGYSSSNTIVNNSISNNKYGILQEHSNSNMIANNSILNNDEGIVLRQSSNLNTIANNFILNNCGGLFGDGCGINLYISSSNTIVKNSISNNKFGIGLEGSSSNQVHYNKIYDNKYYGVYAVEPQSEVNTTFNWWGDASGPYHPINNSAGKGDNVSDYVEFIPWLTVPSIVIGQLVDTDKDGYNDTLEDAFNTDPFDNTSFPPDHDHDYIPDELDPDDDNDGYNDTIELSEFSNPQDNLSIPSDLDNDFIPDSMDDDIDGDGVPNDEDMFPYDPKNREPSESDNDLYFELGLIISGVIILLIVIILKLKHRK
jgi:parallel beta-helix repeat protein